MEEADARGREGNAGGEAGARGVGSTATRAASTRGVERDARG